MSAIDPAAALMAAPAHAQIDKRSAVFMAASRASPETPTAGSTSEKLVRCSGARRSATPEERTSIERSMRALRQRHALLQFILARPPRAVRRIAAIDGVRDARPDIRGTTSAWFQREVR